LQVRVEDVQLPRAHLQLGEQDALRSARVDVRTTCASKHGKARRSDGTCAPSWAASHSLAFDNAGRAGEALEARLEDG
tara:strand:+ start:7673 stop:7906 length:234 start_codon:yes stop_codon:yes gene_type:complete